MKFAITILTNIASAKVRAARVPMAELREFCAKECPEIRGLYKRGNIVVYISTKAGLPILIFDL